MDHPGLPRLTGQDLHHKISAVDERIIDFGEYLRRRDEEAQEERSTFALWGGEGERSRFALPLWRAAYLVKGRRAALVWEDADPGLEALHPFVVLDLAVDPARTDVPAAILEGVRGEASAPACALCPEGLGFYLGEKDGRRWYLVVTGSKDVLTLDGDEKDDLYFLAGECAGLLFHRELDQGAEGKG